MAKHDDPYSNLPRRSMFSSSTGAGSLNHDTIADKVEADLRMELAAAKKRIAELEMMVAGRTSVADADLEARRTREAERQRRHRERKRQSKEVVK